MISSELPEVLGMSDRILVMKDGEVMGEIQNHPGLTQESLMALWVNKSKINEAMKVIKFFFLRL